MSGPKIYRNGEVVSAALRVGGLPSISSELKNNFRIDAGQIVDIYTVDDPQIASPGVVQPKVTLYDVQIYRGTGTSEIIPNCRMLQPSFGGGINNFLEVLPTDPGFNGKELDQDRTLRRGHQVLIGYIGGEKINPVILGTLPHTSSPAVARRPKKGKGTYLEGEIQGLNFIVDNDGALQLVFNGPRKDDGSLVNQNGPTAIEITKDGVINITNNNKQKITIDRISGHIRVDAGPTYIDMDQNGDKIDVVAKNVNVGTGGLQPQVVGDDWKSLMEELITEIMAIYVPTGVGPSGTPLNSPKFAAIKAKLDTALSKKHKVEK